MIRDVIDIEQYNWRAYVFMDAKAQHADEILNLLEHIGIDGAQLMKAERHLQRAVRNSGMTYSSPSERASVVVIGHATSVEETVNTFSHELRHLVDDIAAACGITVSGEEVAYLTGDIALTLASSLLHIVCECPICSSHE